MNVATMSDGDYVPYSWVNVSAITQDFPPRWTGGESDLDYLVFKILMLSFHSYRVGILTQQLAYDGEGLAEDQRARGSAMADRYHFQAQFASSMSLPYRTASKQSLRFQVVLIVSTRNQNRWT